MNILVVEDDFTSRRLLQMLLAPLGVAEVAVDGDEALEAVRTALDEKKPYHLICLDLMLPQRDGYEVLAEIRDMEKKRGIEVADGCKVVITTALDDSKSVMRAFHHMCEAYLVKPINKTSLFRCLKELGLAVPDAALGAKPT